MLAKYKELQKNFYDYITRSFSENKLSHAYLIETSGISYAKNLARDLAKFLICNGVYDAKICNLIDLGNYPGLIEFDGEEIIKKDDILELQRRFSSKSTDDKRQVYIIYDASLLNDFSANSLLKFLEDPSDDVIAIFLVNNVNTVKSTIRSRCQVLNLINHEDIDYRDLFKKYYNKTSSLEDFIAEEYNKYLNFYVGYEKSKEKVLGDKDIYMLCNHMNELLRFGFYLYVDSLYNKLNIRKKKIVDCEDFITNNNEISDIIRKIEVITRFSFLCENNVNNNLFMDNFIISMGG